MRGLRCDRCDELNELDAETCRLCGQALDAGCLVEVPVGASRLVSPPYYPAVDSFVGRHPVQAFAVALVVCVAAAIVLALLALATH